MNDFRNYDLGNGVALKLSSEGAVILDLSDERDKILQLVLTPEQTINLVRALKNYAGVDNE